MSIERTDLKVTAAPGGWLDFVWDNFEFVKGKRCDGTSTVLAIDENILISLSMLSVHLDQGTDT